MFHRKNTLAGLYLLFVVLCFYLYLNLFQSSLRFENKKAMFHMDKLSLSSQDRLLTALQSDETNKWFHPLMLSSSSVELEWQLRTLLVNYKQEKQHQRQEIVRYYQMLLSVKPSWPYYYSGLSQLAALHGEVDVSSIKHSVEYGKHEATVIRSLAEIIFNNWQKLSEDNKYYLLQHFINQKPTLITAVVNISAKFANIYAICDFIYEKKQVEYPACKVQYWQPLKDG